jgi:hypothetical protein
MPLPTFATREEIPDAFRDEYIEKDGKWVPNVEDVSGLKSALERQKEEARIAKARAKELEELTKQKASGLTDEEIAARRKEIEEATAPYKQQVEQMQKQMRGLQLDSRIKTMLGEAGFDAKRIDATFRLIADRFDLNDSGSPILKDKPTADLVSYLRDEVGAKEFPEWVLSKQKASTDAAGSPKDTPVSTADAEKLLTGNPMALLAQANTPAA